MKIALDEHIAPTLTEALKALQGDTGMLGVEIVSARDYPVPKSMSDVPWLEKFAADGGKVVISGDAKMRGKLHEQRALVEAGFMVFFLARQWNRMRSHDKAAMLIKAWPAIIQKIRTAQPPCLFEIPCSWTSHEMRDVTPPAVRRKRAPGRRVRSGRDTSAAPSATPAVPAGSASSES